MGLEKVRYDKSWDSTRSRENAVDGKALAPGHVSVTSLIQRWFFRMVPGMSLRNHSENSRIHRRQLPDLTQADYRRRAFGEVAPLAQGTPDRPRLLAIAGPLGDSIAACARCHGLDGAGRANGAFPRLPIQSASYIYEALRSYRTGERPSGIMQPPAAELDDDEMRALAEYYASASQPSNAALRQRAAPPHETLRLGGVIAHRGFPAGDHCMSELPRS